MNAQEAKEKNIIDMAIGFAAMTRVFAAGSMAIVIDKLESVLPQIGSSKNEQDFRNLHNDFCQWFMQNIKTAERKSWDGSLLKMSAAASYGEGAKLLDVALVVYVYYCNLPDAATAAQTVKWLNAGVDNKMMKQYLKKMPDPETRLIPSTSLVDVDKGIYVVLQNLVRKDIVRSFLGSILPVQWDDIIWRRLNRK